MTVYYVVLALITAAVAAVVISAGHDEKARPSIAGGYDTRGPVACLGPSFDVKQSGEFVNFTNNQSTVGGRLRLTAGGKLTGDVDCVNGKSAHFAGTALAGKQGVIEGMIGGQRVVADLHRDPPDPGTPKPRAPGNIAGTYKLSPRSACFGGTFELNGGGSSYTLAVSTGDLGKVTYNDKTGLIGGVVNC